LPLRRHALTRPLPGAEAPFGRSMPPDRSRSALVVSHHLDGLLQRQGRELVASRYRQGFTSVGGPPTGKPAGFSPTAAHTPQNRALQQWSAPSVRALTRSGISCREIGALDTGHQAFTSRLDARHPHPRDPVPEGSFAPESFLHMPGLPGRLDKSLPTSARSLRSACQGSTSHLDFRGALGNLADSPDTDGCFFLPLPHLLPKRPRAPRSPAAPRPGSTPGVPRSTTCSEVQRKHARDARSPADRMLQRQNRPPR
jgi:hypothetical protein